MTIPIGASHRQFWVSRRRVRNYIVSEIIRGNIRDRSSNVIRQILARYNLPRAYNTQISGMIRRAQQLNNCAVQFNPNATPPRERGMRRDENNRAHPELRPRLDTPTHVLPIAEGGDGMDVDNRSRTPSPFDRDRQFTPSPRPRAQSPPSRTPSPYREHFTPPARASRSRSRSPRQRHRSRSPISPLRSRSPSPAQQVQRPEERERLPHLIIRRIPAELNLDAVVGWLNTATRIEQIIIAQMLQPIRVAWRSSRGKAVLRVFERIRAGALVTMHRGTAISAASYARKTASARRLVVKYRKRENTPRYGYFDCASAGWQMMVDAPEAAMPQANVRCDVYRDTREGILQGANHFAVFTAIRDLNVGDEIELWAVRDEFPSGPAFEDTVNDDDDDEQQAPGSLPAQPVPQVAQVE